MQTNKKAMFIIYQIIIGYHRKAERNAPDKTRTILLGSPHSNIVNLHCLTAHSRSRWGLCASNSVREGSSHCDIENDVESLLDGLRPDCGAQLVLSEGSDQLSVEPELHLLWAGGPIDNNFVDVEVSDAGAAGAGLVVAKSVGLVTGTAGVDILVRC